jgi:hypothetical protein
MNRPSWETNEQNNGFKKPSWETAGASSFKRPSWETSETRQNTSAYLSGSDYRDQLNKPGKVDSPRTPIDQRLMLIKSGNNTLGDFWLGNNLLPAYKEDSTLKKVGKGIINYGLGTIANIFGAPQQALMQTTVNTSNVIQGKPLDFTKKSMKKDILPREYGQFVDKLAEKGAAGQLASGFIQGTVEGSTDPATYLGGGIIDDLSKVGRFGAAAKTGTTENVINLAERQGKVAKKVPLSPAPETKPQTNFYVATDGSTVDNLVDEGHMLPPGREEPTGNVMIDMVRKTVGIPDYSLAKGKIETPNRVTPAEMAARKESKQPGFTTYTDKGPQVSDTRNFTDNKGKTVAQSLQGDEVYDDIIKNLEGTNVISDESVKSVAQNIKDKSGMTLNLKDVYRNFRDAFGRAFPLVKERYLDPFDASKKAYVDTVKQYTDGIYEKVVKGLGIKKGSKESAAVQWYGERQRMSGMTDAIDPQTGKKITVPKMVQYTLEDLQKEFPDSWQKIVQADNIFRNAYDELIDAINRTRAQIYPTNPEKLVPKRNDYYRHFRDMQDSVEGFKNMFETPSQIDPKLAGISEYTKPKSRWASFMQKRGMGAYKADAVGGFIDYIQPASYAINIDPHIIKFRGLAKDIADATEKTRNANGFIKWLNDFSNNLAGKTSKYDRLIQEDIPGGRTAMRVLIWLNNRVKANQVLLNARSAVAQLANVPAGIARIHDPVALGKGIGDTLAGIIGKGRSSKLYSQSQFISERYSQNLVSRFDQNIINQPKRFAAWLLGAFDELGTKYVWNSAYNKAVAEGVKNPVKQADDLTRSVVAGRGIGEVPLMQQSKLFQLVAPFQLEVANLWHIMGDMVKEKDFAGMITLFAGNYLFNNAAEELTGNRVTFDPVDAIIEALTEEDMNAWKMAGRLGGEVLSNIPLGQTAADVYPEYGFNLAGVEMPTRQELFGRNDPTRFGSGLLVVKGMQDPVSKVLPPFGGVQIKKSVEGIDAVNKGGVFKDDKLRYPVENTTENTIKGALFGKSAFDEAREYYDNNRRDLSEKQTQQVMNSTDQEGVYDAMMRQRTIETLKTKIKALKNGKMSGEEKARQIKALQKQLEAAAQ